MEIIKYHEYGKEYEYSEDHMLTNNWDPDRDYGNEYVKVYFNIDTPTYKWNLHGVSWSWNSDQDRNAWKQEASALISSFGILEDCGYAVEHSSDKRAYLYAHPNQISGVIKKNDVKKVAEAIAGMKLSTMRWVDIRKTVYVISDEEYEVYLCSKDEEIRNELFKACRTSRRNLYVRADEVRCVLAERFRIPRLGIKINTFYDLDQTGQHISKMMKQMIEEGLLVESLCRDQMLVRSINKTEQKTKKIECPIGA